MRKALRLAAVTVAMLAAIIAAGLASAHDDGTDAPLVIGTKVPTHSARAACSRQLECEVVCVG